MRLVAKQRDGWLSSEIGGSAEIWAAARDRRISKEKGG
jgi:hypothetical protein